MKYQLGAELVDLRRLEAKWRPEEQYKRQQAVEKWEKAHPTALGLLTNSKTTCRGETDISREESTICSCEFVIVSRRFTTIYTRLCHWLLSFVLNMRLLLCA